MDAYNPKDIEKKWQDKWEADGLYTAHDDSRSTNSGQAKKKFYALVEFPYPSGDGLHTGHPRSYGAMDVICRKRRMEGYSVLYPIGWDAFGLPTENYAIKTGRQPAEVTKENIATFKRQIQSLGISFDWSREVNTTDPEYYKWTQWIFLKLLRAGLAYKATMPINWCPKCKIGLANEEAVGDKCERCEGPTEKKEKEQWMLAITKYAERLHTDLDEVHYLDRIKTQQRNWIGRSEGHEIDFAFVGAWSVERGEKIRVFTTRIDTLFGATYVVLAPEHELIRKLDAYITNREEIANYVEQAKKKKEIERTAEEKDKTGVELKGVRAINPASGEDIPVWVADYVLGHYGTGAVMAVPAHDDRDFAFAKKYNLPVKQVIAPEFGEKRENEERRDGGMGFAFDPVAQRYAIARNDWKMGIFGGGVSEDENIREGIAREVSEESGLWDFKKSEIIWTAYARYRHTGKNLNRITKTTCILFILNSIKTKPVQHEEHEKNFRLEWVTAEQLLENWEKPEWKYIGIDHWFFHFKNAVGRAIELGYDTTSDPKKFQTAAYTDEGILIDSGEFSECTSSEAREKIAAKVGAEKKITYKLRDWVFSRQHYWGEPIPVVHCPLDGIVSLDDSELPLTLPPVEKYQPTDTGESPLAAIHDWVNTLCPFCGGPARRETDTMPNWAGSSWYYLRYTDPHNATSFADATKLKHWTPVDWYNGGMEHTTLHLLYSRFWHKFLFDEGLVPTSEPYLKRTSQGMVLAANGEKMSKSKGNVVNPDQIVARFGADSLRLYELFMGPFDQAIAWNDDSLAGMYRFIERVWNLQEKVTEREARSSELDIVFNQTIKKVSDDIEDMKFNTAISSLMILVNELGKQESLDVKDYKTLLVLLAPFAPHVTEELWQKQGHTDSIHLIGWPRYDTDKLESESIELVIQVSGKIRARLTAPRGITEKEALDKAYSNDSVKRWLGSATPQKVIFVPGKLLNIVL